MTDALRARARDSLLVIDPDGRVHERARAVLLVYWLLGWRWPSWVLWHPPARWGADLAYRWVARNRLLVSRVAFRNPSEPSR